MRITVRDLEAKSGVHYLNCVEYFDGKSMID